MQTDNSKLLIAIVAGLVLMARGCGNSPGPEPQPNPAIVRQSFNDYRSLMGKVWSEGSSRSFATDREAFDWVKGQSELARKAAFAPVHELEQATFGGENWSDAKRQQLWRQFGEECQ